MLEPERFSEPADRDPLEAAAAAWGATRTWALPLREQADTAVCLSLRAARGRQVVVQRDAHPATVAGLVVAGLEPHWLAPEVDPIAGVAHGVTPASLDAALTAAPGARAAIVVAPAFHGALPDVALLASVAHGHGAALVVDETWGAHLPFHPALPAHAIAAGAGLVLSRLGDAMLVHQGRHAERWLPAAAIDRAARLCAPGGPPTRRRRPASRAWTRRCARPPPPAPGSAGCRACACSGPSSRARPASPRSTRCG